MSTTIILIVGLWALVGVGFLLLVKRGKELDRVLDQDDLNYFRRRVRKLELELALAKATSEAALRAQHEAEARLRERGAA